MRFKWFVMIMALLTMLTFGGMTPSVSAQTTVDKTPAQVERDRRAAIGDTTQPVKIRVSQATGEIERTPKGFTNFINPNVADNVSVMGGIGGGAGENSFEGSFEIQKTLGRRFLLDNTIELSNASQTVVGDRAILRGYLTPNVFVGAGARVSNTLNVQDDLVLQPNFQAGLTLNATDKLQFEPYVQLETPDVLSANLQRSLGAAMVVSYSVNSKFGFTGEAGLTQYRNDNRFFDNGGANFYYGTVGLFFNF